MGRNSKKNDDKSISVENAELDRIRNEMEYEVSLDRDQKLKALKRLIRDLSAVNRLDKKAYEAYLGAVSDVNNEFSLRMLALPVF